MMMPTGTPAGGKGGGSGGGVEGGVDGSGDGGGSDGGGSTRQHDSSVFAACCVRKVAQSSEGQFALAAVHDTGDHV